MTINENERITSLLSIVPEKVSNKENIRETYMDPLGKGKQIRSLEKIETVECGEGKKGRVL